MSPGRRGALLCAVIGTAVLATAVTESGAVQPDPGAPAAARAFQMEVDGQYLAAAIDDVPLEEVLARVAREARLRIVTDVAGAQRVTARFQGVPLEEALRRLLPAGGLVFVYGPAAPEAGGMAPARLLEVRAYVASGMPSREPAEPAAPGRRAFDRAGAGGSAATNPLSVIDAVSPDEAALVRIVLGSENRRLRQRAAEALGHLEGGGVVDALGRALQDEDPGVRETAANALGRTWDEGAVAPLSRALLDDGDVWVREAAAQALGAIWSDGAVDVLGGAAAGDRSRSVREAAVEALGRLADPRAVPSLVEALRDPTGAIRERAAEALAAIGSTAALVPLMEAASRDGDPWVRERAEEAIARLSGRPGS